MAASGSQRTIAAIAVIGRQNFVGGSEEYLKLQLSAYASLDVIESKLRSADGQQAGAAAPAPASKDPFLGLLMPVDEYKVFGYVTNTGVRIVVIVRDVLLREDRVRELFRALHRLYADAACNPFSQPDAKLTSPSFEEAVTRLVDGANGQIEYRGPVPF